MIGRILLGLIALALAGFVALVLIGLWDRHSQNAATSDSDGTYERGYPSRSINVVVPFPAGGPSDVVARVVTEQMGNILGQSMVIENVGGAGGTIGSARVAAAPSDGYTLLAGSMGSHVAAPVLTPNLKYDSERDFAPIGFTAQSPAVIVARKDFPAAQSARICGLPEAERGPREAGARRDRRVLAHGMPALRGTGRRQAQPGCLSRHRPCAERSHGRPRRFFLRASRQRRPTDRRRHYQGLRRFRERAPADAAGRADGEGSWPRLSDEHLGRNFRAQGHAEAHPCPARGCARQIPG